MEVTIICCRVRRPTCTEHHAKRERDVEDIAPYSNHSRKSNTIKRTAKNYIMRGNKNENRQEGRPACRNKQSHRLGNILITQKPTKYRIKSRITAHIIKILMQLITDGTKCKCSRLYAGADNPYTP